MEFCSLCNTSVEFEHHYHPAGKSSNNHEQDFTICEQCYALEFNFKLNNNMQFMRIKREIKAKWNECRNRDGKLAHGYYVEMKTAKQNFLNTNANKILIESEVRDSLLKVWRRIECRRLNA